VRSSPAMDALPQRSFSGSTLFQLYAYLTLARQSGAHT
jgi:hypothetical protein